LSLPVRHLAGALALALVLTPGSSSGTIRAVALQGDPAPGVPSATFASFPVGFVSGLNSYTVCNSVGNSAFYANTSTGGGGIWSDDLGSLAPVALLGGSAPWEPGSGTFAAFGQALISDHGHVGIYALATVPTPKYGLWIQNGSGLALAAGDGVSAPGDPGPTTFTVDPDPNLSICLSRSGHLALRATGGSTTCLWDFDPPPSVNRFLCASTYPGYPMQSFTAFQWICFNDNLIYSLDLSYFNGTNPHSWAAEGGCGTLAPILSDGDLAQSVDGIPGAANVTSLWQGALPDLNAENAVVFRSGLVNGGVTAANDEVVWLRDGNGFHVVMREGGAAPELGPGETLGSSFGVNAGSILTQPELVSDAGSVVLEARIQPGDIPAILLYRPDRTLHVLARDRAPVPGMPGREFFVSTGDRVTTACAMNHVGQVLLQCATRDSLDPDNGNKIQTTVFVTDANGALNPIFKNNDTYTVRPGLSGALHISTPGTVPLPSGGSDGKIRNFSDHGEYFFRGTLTPSGGGSPLDGVFAVRGPDLDPASVEPDLPTRTWLAEAAPNPSSSAVRIAFDLARAGAIRLEVFDLAGRRMKTLASGYLPAGRYERRWLLDAAAGRAVARGVYFVRLAAPGTNLVRRLVIMW
jgi:hypothetical protein